MSLCERIMDLSDDLADRLLAADACAATDEGQSLRLLREAIDSAQAVKFGNECARAILASATATFAKQRLTSDPPVAANDFHPVTPETPDPIVA